MEYNHTITISSLGTGAKRAWTESESDIMVYINQIQEDVVTGFDSAPSFLSYRMMTNGNHETINIGDRVTDEADIVYEVKGKSIHSSLVGTHHQYLIIQVLS